MDNKFLIGLIIIAIIVVLVVCCFVVLPKLKKNNDELYTSILDKIEGFVDIGNNLLKYIDDDPKTNNVIETVFLLADKLVKTAENLPDWNKEYSGLSKDELNKKQHKYVADAITSILEVSNIEIDDNLQKVIDVTIDSSVANTLSHNGKDSNGSNNSNDKSNLSSDVSESV